MLVSAFILVVSTAMLLGFFVSYMQQLVAAARQLALREGTLAAAGIEGTTVGAQEFGRLMQLVNLWNVTGAPGRQVRAVRCYYAVLSLARLVIPSSAPVANFVESERERCAHYAAVMLDNLTADFLKVSRQTSSSV